MDGITNVKTLRKKVGLTQEELGKKIGVCQPYICYIENGRVNGLTIGKLKKMAKIFKITPVELLKILLKE